MNNRSSRSHNGTASEMKVFGSNSNFNWKNVIEGLGPLLKKGSGQARPDSRPPSRSRLRQGHVSQDEPLSPLPPPGALGPPMHPIAAAGAPPPPGNSSGISDSSATGGSGGVVVAETTPLSIQFTGSGHYNKMLATLNEMRLGQEQCDIALQVGEGLIHAHKLILVANSPYFRAMFSSGYCESKQSSVELHGLTFLALDLVVQYFYTCKIHISTDNVQEVLSASTLLQVGVVTEACCEFMRRHLGVANCLGVRTFADMHSCSELEQVAGEFTRKNFVTVVESEDFLKLELDQVLDLFSASDLAVPSEESIFDACLKWIKFDPAKRERFVVDLLEKVRLPLLSPPYLFDTVSKVGVVSGTPRAMALIMEALEMQMLPERRDSARLADWLKPRTSNCKTQMILAVGGMGRRELAGTPSIELYDPSTKQWQMQSQMASGRWGAGLVAMEVGEEEEVVYLVGGSNESSRLSSVQRYTMSSDMWSSARDMAFSRNGVGVVTHEGLLYAIGGFDGVSPLRSMECYNPSTNQWTSLPDMSTKRFGLAACASDGLIYAVGGKDNTTLNTAECYNIATATWTTLSPMSMCRKFPGAECISKRIFVMGGIDAANARLRSVEEYIPSLDQWVSICPMLCPRSGLGTAVLGGQIYVIGGHDGNMPLSSMERYDPLTNEWTVQPHMAVGRDCVGTAVVSVVSNARSPPLLHWLGGASLRTSPPGSAARCDSPIIQSSV